ncbi:MULTISPECIES: TetR/AcrR family transcriptional regulator [Streptosporangium]|uniref:AcrR family transcriptional regulator n=1 Tax=Streptosporangium brasiliense TaxID=47480 RepID=A0ABT9QX54_9ACTN|nr:TetR/AcrR family transcriptional regulator [Streptosporangium brasiliense]MDP9861564.1 AcrR family transcriptional regulator [Streptosporangium brasiliense]
MSDLEFNGPRSGSSSEPLRTLLGEPPRERADAARNRLKVLAAAARLFRDKGVDGVSMDAIATEAGVGKGTLFRRFGDKSGLAAALLDERERELQEAILTGPAPLGPGAPAADRLAAFVDAYLDYLLGHLDLIRMSETASPGARYRIGAYRFWHRHTEILLAEARPGCDAGPLAHALLAPLAAEHMTALAGEYGQARAGEAVRALLRL